MHATGVERVVGGVAGRPTTTRSGTTGGNVADEDGRVGHPVRNTNGASSLLGVVGRRTAHAGEQIAPSSSDRDNAARQLVVWESSKVRLLLSTGAVS